MAYKIINIKNNNLGSVSVKTIKGLISMEPGDERKRLFVTDEQLMRILSHPGVVVTDGLQEDEETPFLGLIKELDLNVNVFDQRKLNDAFDKIDAFASQVAGENIDTNNTLIMLSKAASGDMVLSVILDDEFDATDDDFAHEVTLKFTDKGNNIHVWYNSTAEVTASTTSSLGEVSIDNNGLVPVVNGVCTFEVNGTGKWVGGESYVIKVADVTILGKVFTDVEETVDVIGDVPSPTIKNIESVETLNNIEVSSGTELSAVGLPVTVVATLDDSSTQDLAVTWDGGTPAYDKDTAGEYMFAGTLILPEGITNTDDLEAAVKVIVV